MDKMENIAYGWISCDKEFPKNKDTFDTVGNTYYLIWSDKFKSGFAMYIDGEWWKSYQSKIIDNITHWSYIYSPSE